MWRLEGWERRFWGGWGSSLERDLCDRYPHLTVNDSLEQGMQGKERNQLHQSAVAKAVMVARKYPFVRAVTAEVSNSAVIGLDDVSCSECQRGMSGSRRR